MISSQCVAISPVPLCAWPTSPLAQLSLIVGFPTLTGKFFTLAYYPPRSAKLETFPKVSASFLARHGLLAGGAETGRGFNSHYVNFLVFRINDWKLDIITNDDYEPLCQSIKIDYEERGATYKPYFICPILGVRCTYIIFLYGLWASRRAHGLRTRNGTSEQRRRAKLLRLREEILDLDRRKGAHSRKKSECLKKVRQYLSSGNLLPDAWRGLGPIFHEDAQEQRRAQRNSMRSRHPEELSLAHAIERGCNAHASVELGMHLANRRRNTVAGAIEATIAAPRAVRPQENHVMLDLGPLRSRGWLRAGRMSSWILDWPDLVPNADRVLLVADLTTKNHFICLEFISAQGFRVASQTIELRERPSMLNRLFLACPIKRTFHDKLYFRDGFFASPSAQRLKSASQLG